MIHNIRDKKSEDVADNARGKIERGFDWLEHWIAPGPYALGEQRSVADCAIAPVLFFVKTIFPLMGMDTLPDFGPNTARYFDAVQKDADVSRCLARMEEGRRERFG